MCFGVMVLQTHVFDDWDDDRDDRDRDWDTSREDDNDWDFSNDISAGDWVMIFIMGCAGIFFLTCFIVKVYCLNHENRQYEHL